jgi:putative salt-induced outer membrane protein YdiY
MLPFSTSMRSLAPTRSTASRGTRRAMSFLPALLTLAIALPLAAQDAPPPLQVTTDLGFVNAAGNTDVTTFNVGEELLYTTGPWGIKQTFGVVYGRTDGEVSTSLWRAGIRGDRSVGARLGIYLLGAFDRNTFAGITRRFEEGAGLVLKALETPTDRLEFEAGAGLTQQRSTERVNSSFASARAAGTYRRSFGEASYVQLTSELLPNLEESEDLRVNSGAELVAPISAQIAMKLAYVIRFDNLPEPGFEKTDRLFTAGLQISF